MLAIVLLVVGKKAGWFGTELTVKVLAGNVERQIITEKITANGKIQPMTKVKISPDVSGEIIELFVKEGDPVNPGDPLVVIKPDLYRSALSRSEAALNSSHARLAQTEAQLIERDLAFKRAQQLYQSQTIPKAEFETAQAAFKVTEAEVKAARFSVKAPKQQWLKHGSNLQKPEFLHPSPELSLFLMWKKEKGWWEPTCMPALK